MNDNELLNYAENIATELCTVTAGIPQMHIRGTAIKAIEVIKKEKEVIQDKDRQIASLQNMLVYTLNKATLAPEVRMKILTALLPEYSPQDIYQMITMLTTVKNLKIDTARLTSV